MIFGFLAIVAIAALAYGLLRRPMQSRYVSIFDEQRMRKYETEDRQRTEVRATDQQWDGAIIRQQFIRHPQGAP